MLLCNLSNVTGVLLAQTSSDVDWGKLGQNVLGTIIYTSIGLVFFALAYWIITKMTKYSVDKELEEEQNVAMAIVIGSVILGIAWIIAAAIHG
jgi:uncharacterized membrane protein YjfL (UPF0719 family)